MSCNCKADNNQINQKDSNKPLKERNKLNFILRLIAFSIGIVLLPVIMIAVVWFMFDLLMLNNEIDMKKIVSLLTSKIKPFNEDYNEFNQIEDDEDDEDEFTEENYEMIDVEEITPVTTR